jgi:hypothetical protein|tara:strand:- start:115 stop:495 length:381 start_codon:yes stop_codon:yes gene_type:complete
LEGDLPVSEDTPNHIVTDRFNRLLLDQEIPELSQGPLVERTTESLGWGRRYFCDKRLLLFCQTAWSTGSRSLAKRIKALIVEVAYQFTEILFIHPEVGRDLLNTHPLTTKGDDLGPAHLNSIARIP